MDSGYQSTAVISGGWLSKLVINRQRLSIGLAGSSVIANVALISIMNLLRN